MNNPSPLIPQGSIMEQKNRSRSRMRVAFLFIASVHIVGLVTLLTMQGCKREQPVETPVDNPTAQNFNPTNNQVAETNYTSANVASNTAPVEPIVPIAPVATTSEYIVVKGDSFFTIGKAHGVSVNAIKEANPGVDSTKLKIGQPLKLPAPSTTPASLGTSVAPTTVADTYKVKSGDTLTSIAKAHGIKLQELRAANSLTTDRIKVGDTLKIPGKALTAPEMSPAGSAMPTTTPGVR
jgi:LysM repeat protein